MMTFVGFELLVILVFFFLSLIDCSHNNDTVITNNTIQHNFVTFDSQIPVYFKPISPERHFDTPLSLFTCICIAPYELNATLPILSRDGLYKEPFWRNSVYKFKILHCPKKNIHCRIWKPQHELTTDMCNYEEDKKKVNIKAALRKSCTIILKPNALGHRANDTNKNKSEKTEQTNPIIKTHHSKLLAFVLYLNSTSTLKMKNVQKLLNEHKVTFGNDSWTKRIRRSSSFSLKPMIFPHLNRNLLERKRNGSKEINMPVKSINENAMRNDTKNVNFYHEMLFNETHNTLYQRHKRETHILMAKYRKAINKSSRKKRPKPTLPPSSCDDDNNKIVNTTPYTFLNVSFTGYWEPPQRTTVKPRVRQPLKMSEQDRNFVYGGGTKKPDKGRNKGKSGGWSSKIKVSFKS